MSVHQASLSKESIVSLSPEEDSKMEDIEPYETVGRVQTPEPEADSGLTYVLIPSHSFSFATGDLRLWLQHLGIEALLTNIAGIYQLLQSNYRVNYLFEVHNMRDIEILRFKCAVMG
ncbi:hypothetical protein B0H14DRAFT_3430658 [Mycena olivaceomarginata]|nr:hypothetical protein B0H14DRAFT_3430658 [Mycena olivaceomarginata]